MKRPRNQDYSKNIKINININVNNNTNDVNITSFNTNNKSIVNDVAVFNESDSMSECSKSSKENIKDEIESAIKSLLFYKIDMPASSSNRSILNSLESINNKLGLIKNCNVYLVYNL